MEGNLAYRLDDDLREELVGGKIIMMASPTSNHNRVSGNIHTIFNIYLKGRKCEAFPDGEALYLEEGAEEYRPDGMVVCDPDKVKWKGVYGAPDLVVEVLSPGTAHRDRGHKKDVYEKHGVREYWIVDPEGRAVEQYVLNGGRFTLRGVVQQYPSFMLEDMTEAERAEVATEFTCALFHDLTIRLEDVFYRVVTPGV